MNDLSELTLSELKERRIKWIAEAEERNMATVVSTVVKYFGVQISIPNRREWAAKRFICDHPSLAGQVINMITIKSGGPWIQSMNAYFDHHQIVVTITPIGFVDKNPLAGKCVLSIDNHKLKTEWLFIPGEWDSVLDRLYGKALEQQSTEFTEIAYTERKWLLEVMQSGVEV